MTDPTAGVPLRDVLRATPRLAPERAALVLGGVARALAARGVAHGALAPERVLLGPGDAVALAPPPRPDGGAAPWPMYLAPEQIDGRPADARSDVYALGLLGWEMLAGRQPWEGDSLYGIVVKQREQDLPRLSTLRPGLPRPLVLAIEGALHKAPGDRWQDAAEVLNVLGPLGGRAVAPAAPFAAPSAVPFAALPPRPTPPAPVAPPRAPEPYAADDEPDVAARARPVRAPGRAEPAPPRRRWLTVTALVLAALAAASGAFAVVRGRADSTATRVWLDSVTATAGGATAAAAPAVTTRENTTSAPVRRTGGYQRRDVDDAESPDPGDEALLADSGLAVPAPFPPPTPTFPRRPGRPTVPLDSSARPDTLVAPDSLRR